MTMKLSPDNLMEIVAALDVITKSNIIVKTFLCAGHTVVLEYGQMDFPYIKGIVEGDSTGKILRDSDHRSTGSSPSATYNRR
jgi:hypothetical protein